MRVTLGMGEPLFAYCHTDKQADVVQMLLRIADAYVFTLQSHDLRTEYLHRNCTVIFADEQMEGCYCALNVSRRDCGIYVGADAYQMQVAKQLYHWLGFPIVSEQRDGGIEIGIGDLEAWSEGYVLLKDAFLGLPRCLLG